MIRTEFPVEVPAPRVCPASLAIPLRLACQFAEETEKRGLRGGAIIAAVMTAWIRTHSGSSAGFRAPTSHNRRLNLTARGAALLDREVFRRNLPPGVVVEEMLAARATEESNIT